MPKSSSPKPSFFKIFFPLEMYSPKIFLFIHFPPSKLLPSVKSPLVKSPLQNLLSLKALPLKFSLRTLPWKLFPSSKSPSQRSPSLKSPPNLEIFNSPGIIPSKYISSEAHTYTFSNAPFLKSSFHLKILLPKTSLFKISPSFWNLSIVFRTFSSNEPPHLKLLSLNPHTLEKNLLSSKAPSLQWSSFCQIL